MTGKEKKRLILLDAHAILHRAYHALPDFSSSKGEPTGALYGLASMLIKIAADLKPDYIVAAYDLPKPTYRHEAYKDYKAGRAKADPELVAQMKRSREIFEAFSIPIYDKEGFEADDILGTIVEKLTRQTLLEKSSVGQATNNKNALDSRLRGNDKDVDIIIASGDMDTLQLVDDKRVQVYTLKKGIQDTILYDEEAVVKRFGFPPKLLPDYKGLRGDPSDNIIGIKGIGEKTGSTLIQTFGAIEEMYKALKKGDKKFKDAGLTDRIIGLLKDNQEEAEFSKMLATIRRDAPIDFVLPEKPWREMLDMGKVSKFFAELEFRALGARLVQALTGKGQEQPTRLRSEASDGQATNNQQPTTKEKSEQQGAANIADGGLFATVASTIAPPPAEALAETALALWLVNSNITTPTLEDVLNFSGAKTFEEARLAIFKRLAELKLTSVFETIEKPLMPVVRSMKERGIAVDKECLKKLSKEYHGVADGLQKKIWKLAEPYTQGSGMEKFNVSSPKQLGVVLFEKLGLKAARQKKTAGGALSTKESELEKLRETHPIIGLILEYRELTKLLGTYIDTIPDMVEKDSRLHAQFLQSGTTTGRMGCENPNLQNIPNKTELGRAIRHAFVAEKGFKLVAFDYSQIELRIAAFLSGDKKLIEIFKDGEDVHTAVAAEVFGVPGDKVHPDMRRKAKVINFGVMYGMGVNALRGNLGGDPSTGSGQVTREEAQKFYNDYFEKFSGLARYLESVKAEARRTGFTETFFGRRRYFPGITSKLPFIRAAAERMAINAPIQGTEADIIKIAMARADEWIKKEKFEKDIFLLLQVHDELVYEIKEELVKKASPKIKEIMENVLSLKDTAGVPIVVDAKVGDNWGEMKKIQN